MEVIMLKSNLNYNVFTIMVSITLIAITYIISYGTTEHKKVVAMSQAVSEASSKGINPIATRCAFAQPNDTICIVYAAKVSSLQTVEK
jgi:hypothetical protein